VQINGPLWSVATEWQIYFFLPLLLLPTWRRFGMTGTLLVAAGLGYAPLLVIPGPAHVAIPWYLLLFAFGMVAAAVGFSPEVLAVKLREMPWRRVSLVLWGTCAALALGAAKLWFASKPATDALLGLATAALLIHLTALACAGRGETSWLLRVLESAPLVGLGHFSYSLYLSHLPIMALCFLVLPSRGLSPIAFAALFLSVSTAVSAAFAYVFFLCFERPFIVRR
jgi:peptidoglycan/LPS O-acetylase OafA/YrhL